MITTEIVNACKQGRPKAQRQLFDFFAPHMFNLCKRYLSSHEEAEDIMSQGFTKVFGAIEKMEYRDLESLRAWIKKIMINEALMQLRKTVKFSLVSVSEAEDFSYPDQRIEELDSAYIISAINGLPAGYRTVLNLYAIEGYKHSEIAKMLNINESTSRSQLNKARNMLKNKLYSKDAKGII